MSPREFEKYVSKIHTILDGKDSIVTWDAKIPDPDNPEQPRQVDVLIERDNEKTIIECRHHKRPQDVKWIEEIYGRRESLMASSAIAVSSAGFTEGAIKKAKRFGVILRVFSELTVNEVNSWGGKVGAEVAYTKFNFLEINLIYQSHLIIPLSADTDFKDKSGNPYNPWPIFNAMLQKTDEFVDTFNWFKLQIFPDDLYVSNLNIDELVVQGIFKKYFIRADLPIVETYGSPENIPLEQEVKIEKSIDDIFHFYHTPQKCVPIVDVSKIRVPLGSIFRNVKLNLKTPTNGIHVTGLDKPINHMMPLKIKWMNKNSNEYKMFFR